MTADLKSYFDRIGYEGPQEASLAVLEELHGLHPSAIPFENIDPLLKRPVNIDLASIDAKLVGSQRGGYCYEHNRLFCDVLAELGFAVTPLAARVIWNRPKDGPRTAHTHRLTKVELKDGAYIADVGFGGNSPTKPIKFEIGLEQPTPHGTYRIVKFGDDYELQVALDGNWAGLYRFSLASQEQADFEVGNWFTSTHPASHFTFNLTASRVVGDARYNLLNARLTVRRHDQAETSIVETAQKFEELLVERFGIACPVPISQLWDIIPKAA